MSDETPVQRLRLTYTKGEALKYISHLDLARAWERAFRRAGLPAAHTQGFNPRPRFQLAAALPVGVMGSCEMLDLWLTQALPAGEVLSRLRRVLPPGLQAMSAEEVDLRAPALQALLRAADYRAMVHSGEPPEAIEIRIQALLACPAILRRRIHKGHWETYDLRPLIQTLKVESASEGVLLLTMRLEASPQGAGRPSEVLDALGLADNRHAMERCRLYFAEACASAS